MYGKYKLEQSQEREIERWENEGGTLPPIQGIFTGRKEDSDFQNAIEAFRKKQPYFKARIYEVNGSDGTGSKATGGGDGDRSSQASEQEGTGTKRKCNPDEDV